jgi:hypothetical protein
MATDIFGSLTTLTEHDSGGVATKQPLFWFVIEVKGRIVFNMVENFAKG